jgi:hypothetical protein
MAFVLRDPRPRWAATHREGMRDAEDRRTAGLLEAEAPRLDALRGYVRFIPYAPIKQTLRGKALPSFRRLARMALHARVPKLRLPRPASADSPLGRSLPSTPPARVSPWDTARAEQSLRTTEVPPLAEDPLVRQ